ncbi:MAG TPA: hypothetical protein VGK93_08245 [Candidatus Eisenbacteria bacterium]|jgi:hypothetical protein
MKNDQTPMRAIGWVPGTGSLVLEVRGPKLAILSTQRLIEVDLPGEAVAVGVGQGPTVVLADGRALRWDLDRREWKAVGNLRMDPVAVAPRRSEPRVEIVRNVPKQAIVMGTYRALRTFQLGRGEILREDETISLPRDDSETRYRVRSGLLELVVEPVEESEVEAKGDRK